MQNLREHLLKAGLVTKEQVARVESEKTGKKKKRRPPRKKGDAAQAGPRTDPKKTPVNRMIDLSDPKKLEVAQAIEMHRVREETKGDHAFHFALRDGRVRKLFVDAKTQSGLERGTLAIVENGETDVHVIVSADAVPAIIAVDHEIVRFHNKN